MSKGIETRVHEMVHSVLRDFDLGCARIGPCYHWKSSGGWWPCYSSMGLVYRECDGYVYSKLRYELTPPKALHLFGANSDAKSPSWFRHTPQLVACTLSLSTLYPKNMWRCGPGSLDGATSLDKPPGWQVWPIPSPK